MGKLFLIGLADIFSIYPKIFQQLLDNENEKRRNEGGKLQKDFLYLPSDSGWQAKVYYRLLEVQKRINALIESGIEPIEIDKKDEAPQWDPFRILEKISPAVSPTTISDTLTPRKQCIPDLPIKYIDIKYLGTWSIENIVIGAKLLKKPPIPIVFDDEYEMRKVYSLIYDVFRYKNVLSETLNDVSFYSHYPELKKDESRVWLMLFELYVRHFLKRKPEEIDKQNQLYKEAEVDYIAECLWIQRVRIAAAMARLRIKNGALLLSQLLPVHLQNEKVAIAAANPIVTGWMNPFKIKDKNYAVKILEKMGMTEVIERDGKEQPLKPNQYKWDKICPLFISCLPDDRSNFARSDLVKNYYFIMQDRTFSIAPAILSRLLDHFDLEGDIVQTHVSSPRSTAYLAALLYSISRVKEFLAFGAGQNLSEYSEYIKTLGVSNLRLFAGNFCNLSLESPILGTVVGVFATPPNSFSGIADPIDLICSRGGDLSMLTVLTESEISDEGKDRVAQILEEQRDTLRLAMSRPQIQFVLYETHSIVGSENQDMIEKAVEDINRCAFEKHLEAYKEKKRLEKLAEIEATGNIPAAALGQQQSSKKQKTATIVGASKNVDRQKSNLSSDKKIEENTTTTNKQRLLNKEQSQESTNSDMESEEDYSKSVQVPGTDEFFISDVPDICLNQDKCLNFGSLGCFVSLIQRKEVTKLDAKYLIKMAEARGLFGSADKSCKSAKTRSVKKIEKNSQKRKDSMGKSTKLKKEDISVLIDRLTQPTHASLIRSNLRSFSSIEGQPLPYDFSRKTCTRHGKYHRDYPYSFSYSHISNGQYLLPKTSKASIWWKNTVNYISNLKNSETLENDRKSDTNTKKHLKVRHSNLEPLRLPRPINEYYNGYFPSYNIILEKKPFPVTINQLEFNGSRFINYNFKFDQIPKHTFSFPRNHIYNTYQYSLEKN